MPSRGARRGAAWRAGPALGVALSLAVAGCVSMPSGGPVLSYPVSQSANAPNQNILQFVPNKPLVNGSPIDIVSGFITAGASFDGRQKVAREYLTAAASSAWNPGWSATVFRGSPTVTGPVPGRKQDTASVTVQGSAQAILSGRGAYAVASARPTNAKTYHYDLVKDRAGQWRISNAHNNPLLLTSTEFAADYQLLNLYFFDPSGQHLVPDPVYVPLQATEDDLVNPLVHYLLHSPVAPDWLWGTATHTEFPSDTIVKAVTLGGGTASVYLASKLLSHASDTVKEQISAQLRWTLTGAGQGQQQQVKSIELYINGKPFIPPGNPGTPVQNQANQFQPVDSPPQGGFYYLKPTGQLMWRSGINAGRAITKATIGRGYTSLAVSPDGRHFAVLKGGSLYTGEVGSSKLAARDVSGQITSLSWDRNDYLWVVAATNVYRLSAVPGQPPGPPASVAVPYRATCGSTPVDVTSLRVAPDGVRVAVVFGGPVETLAFGAIAIQDAQPRPDGQPQSQVSVNLSPFFVCGSSRQSFKALSWYGADDVIALGEPGDTVTDYPVNGGTANVVPGPAGSTWITASRDGGVILSQAAGISIAQSPSSAWYSLPAATSPAFPG